jgi:hypothetical protein
MVVMRGKFSEIIKGIQSHIVSSKIEDLDILGDDLDIIKETVESEVVYQGYSFGSVGYSREFIIQGRR